MTHDDPVLSRLAANLVNRRLFRIEIQNFPFSQDITDSLRHNVAKLYHITEEHATFFVRSGSLSNHAYSNANADESILVMQKDKPVDITVASDLENLFGMSKIVEKYFLCYPKELAVAAGLT
jgi:hypothetical protein